MISFQGNVVQRAQCLSCRCVPVQKSPEASQDDPYLPGRKEKVAVSGGREDQA